jgi:multiple sugar transport system ATP-binding protein
LPLSVTGSPGAAVTLAVRPEAVHVGGGPRTCALTAKLRRRENLGAETILHFDLAAAPGTMICRIAHDGGAPLVPTMDGELQLRFDAEACHVFDADGRRMVTQAASTRQADGIASIGLTAGALR